MITTTEAIVNPIDFLRDGLNKDELFNDNDWQIVSGSDYDVLVQRQVGDGFGVTVDSVSPIYDRLYPRGLAKGVQILDQTVSIEWYLSPTAANRLSEQLGLTPTVDVLEFTHTEEDQITRYTPFIQQGKYPQSTGNEFFTHDRYRLHAPGIWLMTAAGVAKLKKSARTSHATPITLDMATGSLLMMAENLLEADFDVSKIETQYGYGSSATLLDCGSAVTKFFGKPKTRRGEHEYNALSEHLQQDLLPAIQKLLPEKPTLKDQALAVFKSLTNEA